MVQRFFLRDGERVLSSEKVQHFFIREGCTLYDPHRPISVSLFPKGWCNAFSSGKGFFLGMDAHFMIHTDQSQCPSILPVFATAKHVYTHLYSVQCNHSCDTDHKCHNLQASQDIPGSSSLCIHAAKVLSHTGMDVTMVWML